MELAGHLAWRRAHLRRRRGKLRQGKEAGGSGGEGLSRSGRRGGGPGSWQMDPELEVGQEEPGAPLGL